MTTKERVLQALKNPDFPDLEFLYSSQVLDIAPEILEELLEEEKRDFENKLETPDEEICFETFDDYSLLGYIFSLLEHYQSVHNDEVIRKIIEDFEPKYIDFGNEVAYSTRYYEMLKICIKATALNQQQTRIIEKSIESFEIRWIALNSEKQNELKAISKKLSELQQNFSNNILDSKKEFEYLIENKVCLSEMPKDDLLVAKQRAEKKQKSWYLFDSSQGSYMSIMKYCSDSELRKIFYEARQNIATRGKYSNKKNILEILELRNKKALLLWCNNYAELSLHFKMAESPEQIVDLFSEISTKARPKAQAELDEISEYFHLESLQNWDVSYYANKLKQEKYAFDSRELKKYFVFKNVLDGMFETIYKLYNLEFKEVKVGVYNNNVTVYEK